MVAGRLGFVRAIGAQAPDAQTDPGDCGPGRRKVGEAGKRLIEPCIIMPERHLR